LNIELDNKSVLLTAQRFSNFINSEMSYIQSPAYLEIKGLHRIYFCSRKVSEILEGNYISRIYFVDYDENFTEVVNFSKYPIAELGEIGTFDEHGTNPISVIKYLGKILIYYVGWSRSVSVPYTANIGLLVSTSADGSQFERVFPGPVIPFDREEPFLLGSPRVKEFNGLLYMWYVAGKSWNIIKGHPEPTYKIRMATSVDGIHWHKIKRDLIADTIGEFECQAAPEVIALRKGYAMLYSYRSNSRQDLDSEYQVNVAYSDDLENWKVESANNSKKLFSSNMNNTSYYNLVASENGFKAIFQLENMGKTGIGTGILRVREE
jgi:hypothetical protein